jgi:ATP-dependent DNA ligase
MIAGIPEPLEPMLAKRVDDIPTGDGWLFEPKWDGFRAIVFRDGDRYLIQSRDKKPLNRYFPELEAPILAQLPERFVGDGELVIAKDDGLDFEALQMRIHPAASRVAMLAEEIPAALVLWDCIGVGDENLMQTPFAERRARLEQLLAAASPPIFVTPVTRDRDVAGDWFERFEGAGLDGVMAKQLDRGYEPGKRSMLKVKHQRTADCVVAGFRWHKNSKPNEEHGGTLVGSLLLGLYDADGTLHHVGVAASFKEQRRRELVHELQPYRDGAEGAHPWWSEQEEAKQRRPGATSRWNANKDLSFVPLRPELCVEVSYDHMQGRRFRHTAHFVRWRKDKPARACDYAQLDKVAPYELAQIFART